jgi:hypothetical protein
VNFDKVKLTNRCAARHALGRLTIVQRKRVEGLVSRLIMGVGLKLHSRGSASIYCSVRSLFVRSLLVLSVSLLARNCSLEFLQQIFAVRTPQVPFLLEVSPG